MSSPIVDRQSEIEPKAVLPGAPWAIAHKSMLEANKPCKLTLNSQDYVIWKNKSDRVFALNNTCPHLQAPLANGWICPQTNAIVCPFHGLRFNSTGKLGETEKTQGETLAQPLELIVQKELIWTYGNSQPKLPVPDLLPFLTDEHQFLGVAGEKSITAYLYLKFTASQAIAIFSRKYFRLASNHSWRC